MIYLSQMLGKPVVDATGEAIGTISDVAIATGEVFPRVTSLAFLGPDKAPFMLSWRKYVDSFDGEKVTLNAPAHEIRFSYLQPDEVLLHRDLLNKQIVDTQGMKVVRVNDLKLSESRNQLRLLGAEVGIRGILRGISPALERLVEHAARALGRELPEKLIAWNYMDLLDRDLSQVKLSVTHKRLHELHPADVADIIEQLTPSQRAVVFAHLDNKAAAETISELEDELQANVIDDLSESRASDLLAQMDPDDAADIIGDLPYDKAERLLRLMGVEDASAIRQLLGYKEKTAGGIMTPEVTVVTEDMTVEQVIEHLREVGEEAETLYYVYVVEDEGRLTGVISLRDLLLAQPDVKVSEIATRDLFTVSPDDDQEDVAELMSKYDLLALPVVDERGMLLGVVTVDDALDVLEEEAEEDLALATGSRAERGGALSLVGRLWKSGVWVAIWLAALIGSNVAVMRAASAGRPISAQVNGGLSLMAYAAVLLPILLRTGEESSSRAVAELISGAGPDERPSFGRRLATEGAVGLGAAIVVGLLGFVWVEALRRGASQAVPFGIASALAVLLTVLFGSLLAQTALSRSDAGHEISTAALSTVSMVFAAVVYLGLAFVAGYLSAVIG